MLNNELTRLPDKATSLPGLVSSGLTDKLGCQNPVRHALTMFPCR